jgi:transcription-repair coupling factor
MLRPDPVHIQDVVQRLREKKKVDVGGLYGSSQTLFVAELSKHVPQVVFIIAEEHLERVGRELTKLIPETVIIDARNPFYQSSTLIITTHDMLMHDLQQKETIELRTHEGVDVEHLQQRLQATGFTREDIVEEENEYALRGGIMDILEPHGIPVRLEFYGDKVFSIRTFNTQSQRSIESIDKATFTLARLERPTQPLITSIKKEAVMVSEQPISGHQYQVVLGTKGDVQYNFTPARKYFGDIRSLREDMARKQYSYIFCIPYPTLAEKLRSLLGEIAVLYTSIEEGFVDEQTNTVYLTEAEIFGEIRRARKVFRGPFIDDLMGLKENDYVVHIDYGIGQFKGLTFIELEQRKVECLRIDYAGADKVYLPIERLNLLERYITTDVRPPHLSRLGSELWLKAKRRVRKSTERLALNLLQLYARRMQVHGFAFSPDTFEMAELEATFPYEETEDQQKAIDDVKHAMESPRPQERLICGDVGYGKTEIALRAAFKAALDSKQTMILCPTTLLALQHYTTFKKRLEPFPVTVGMVSRFRKKEEIREILQNFASGKIDIVIGTHRLLQPDVQYKDLGLLIIDEEQRFGVAQKEKIKQHKPGLDILYLSATPIPRTLYMALTGLRDISNIYTPPPGRKDIVTKIIYYNIDEIKKTITFEIQRGGQVFFIHNRIQTIETVRKKLHTLLPQYRICVIHGRMRESVSEQRMVAFLRGDYEILLSTAIVESGLDMPRVNTIIVDNAHTFGLADLHQLRGRVGRSNIQAYAYFIIPSASRMSDEVNKRLGALTSYTSLGSGFRLALRDMEIRGVGNILGKEQSGYIHAIGYYHYIKMLRESIDTLQGKFIQHEPILDLKMDAYFPDDYIQSAYERTALYKRILDVESEFELASIKDEIIDRFGQYPQEVANLFILSNIRLHAKQCGATEVIRKGEEFVFYKEGNVLHRRSLD